MYVCMYVCMYVPCDRILNPIFHIRPKLCHVYHGPIVRIGIDQSLPWLHLLQRLIALSRQDPMKMPGRDAHGETISHLVLAVDKVELQI